MIWFAAGAIAAVALWFAMKDVFARDVLARTNLRGRRVPTAGGIVVVLAVVVVAAVKRGLEPSTAGAVIAATGFGVLGAVDDLAGDDADKGFAGHVRAALRGRLTTGGAKLLGGFAVAALACDVARPAGVTVPAVIVVAGCANLGNLFDRAPGRTGKVAILALLALVAASGPAAPFLRGPFLVVGACTGLLWFDLRERVMLGDTGANVVGAALGLGAVGAAGDSTVALIVAAAGVIALNLTSEVASFSTAIERVAPLRWLDRLGREKVYP